MSKKKNFKASRGWLKNFLKRGGLNNVVKNEF